MPASSPPPRTPVALMFPGQGSQHAGMGRAIAERSAAAADVFRQADAILDFRVSDIVMNGTDRDLEKTVNTQPAIMAVSWAYLVYLRERAAELAREQRW